MNIRAYHIMHDDIERIYAILEEIRDEIREIKHQMGSSSLPSPEEREARRIAAAPSSSMYVTIEEKSSWDSSSIDNLIE